MLKAIALFTVLSLASCGASIAANPTANAANADSANVSKRPVIQGRVQKKEEGVKHKIDLGSDAKKPSSNTFSDISASMPAAAVKEDLRRKHELPSAQTSILQPGAAVGSAPGGGATNAAHAAASQGGAADGLRGNGLATPETKGAAENQFYK